MTHTLEDLNQGFTCYEKLFDLVIDLRNDNDITPAVYDKILGNLQNIAFMLKAQKAKLLDRRKGLSMSCVKVECPKVIE